MLDLLGNSGSRGNCDPRVDFHCSFHRFNIVELHDRFRIDFIVAEYLIHRLAGGNIGIETDEFVLSQHAHVGVRFAGKWVVWVANGYEPILPKRDNLDLPHFYREGDESEINRIMQYVFVNKI